jgi:Ca2+-binding RTX toxin-like protein
LAVTAGSGAFNTFVWASTGDLNYVGGNSPFTIVGGGGNETVSGAAATLFGSSGSDVTYSSGSVGSMEFVAGSGNETLNASASGTNNLIWGGQASGDLDTLIGGTGNDTLVAGKADESLIGNTNSADWFVFIQANGGSLLSDQVTGFGPNSVLWLANYGAGEAQYAYTHATASGSNTVVSLTDGTTITFINTSVSQFQQDHVIST